MSGIFLGADVWVGSDIRFNDGTNPVEIWDYDTEMGFDVPVTPHQVLSEVLVWLNDGPRAWSGVITSVLSVSTTDDPALGHTLTFTGGTFDVRTNDAFLAATGIDDSGGQVSSVSGAGPHGVVGEVRMRNWIPRPDERGLVSQSGSWAMHGGGPSGDVAMARVTIGLDEAQAAQFAAAQRVAGSPRIASVFDSINDTFRLVSLGRTRARQRGRLHQVVTASVRG